MKFFNLFRHRKNNKPAAEAARISETAKVPVVAENPVASENPPKPEVKNHLPYLSQWHTFGVRHSSCEPARVDFINESLDIHKTIVDDSGNILHFPGIENPEEVLAQLKDDLPEPRIYYRTDFERRRDGLFLMIWQIQPDGRYWADSDGYGMTNDEEVRLYSLIDERGNFLFPFRLYNVGRTRYYQFTPINPDA